MEILIVGDVHGHLQLTLNVAALWQDMRGKKLDLILLCGDVATFSDESHLDDATRRHAEKNPLELEFLHQWREKLPSWIEAVFRPKEEGGLGLEAQIVMVHGNHEDFYLLGSLTPDKKSRIVSIEDLPAIHPSGRIRYLPSTWILEMRGFRIAGLGGIDPDHRKVNYHPMAYFSEGDIASLIKNKPYHILLTHQGPAITQGKKGSRRLDKLVENRVAEFWFHGHGAMDYSISKFGSMTIVPLANANFGTPPSVPDSKVWAWLSTGKKTELIHGAPAEILETLIFWNWIRKGEDILIPPTTAGFAF